MQKQKNCAILPIAGFLGMHWRSDCRMRLFKRALCEFAGTLILIFIGCGTAMTVGVSSSGESGRVVSALAFGFGLLAATYSVGRLSGGHFNPAVSFAALIKGDIGYGTFFAYISSQTLGSFAGAGVLALIFSLGEIEDRTKSLFSNSLGGVNGNIAAGLITELLLTAVFVIVFLGVTDQMRNGGAEGLILSFALTGVHLLGIGLTGASVNPARSIGSAVVSALSGNVEPLGELWIFIVAPFAGAALASLVYMLLTGKFEDLERQTTPTEK